MVLIVVLFSLIIMYKINNALVKLEFQQEALCYDIYVLDREVKREEVLMLNKASNI